jgi:hypothetical protein
MTRDNPEERRFWPRPPSPLTVVTIVALTIGVHGLAIVVPALLARHALLAWIGQSALRSLVGVLILTMDLPLQLVMLTLFSGAAGRVLRLRYSGRHQLDFRLPDPRRWLTCLVVYYPTAAILNLLHFYPLKAFHIRLFGGTIGPGAVVGGLVTDPCLLMVGRGALIGGFSLLLGHAVERGEIIFDEIHIGDRCGIGAGSVVLPGAVIENDGVLAAQSLLPKGARVPSGRTYGGVPARDLAARRTT